MKLRKAQVFDVPAVARLFDLYRQFYDCEPDPDKAESFIRDRVQNGESIIFIATDDADRVMGFTQLYPSYCSVEAIKILILYDLYVDSEYRNHGVGEALMNKASQHAMDLGAARLDLLTAKDNFAGQHLYEKLGYRKTNENFFAYSLYP